MSESDTHPIINYLWGVVAVPIGFLYQKIYSFNGFKTQTEQRLKTIEESKSKVWENITKMQTDISCIREDLAFLRGKFDQ